MCFCSYALSELTGAQRSFIGGCFCLWSPFLLSIEMLQVLKVHLEFKENILVANIISGLNDCRHIVGFSFQHLFHKLSLGIELYSH